MRTLTAFFFRVISFLALTALAGCVETEIPKDGDNDGYAEAEDCDDGNPDMHPAADELCDGKDNDCDGEVDEAGAADANTWYLDADGDTYGDPTLGIVTCEMPQGYVQNDFDCNDDNEAINPDAVEACDEIDNDCDGTVDVGAEDAFTWYRDADGDTYGADEVSVERCEELDGYVIEPGDCDDGRVDINPAANEMCNGLDDDCDGETDEADALDAATWYEDADGDGYGTELYPTTACWLPDDHSAEGGDCDDANPDEYPGAPEYCDYIDNDCDKEVDEDDAVDATTWYRDADQDGWGDEADSLVQCEEPSGYVAQGSDCDDARADVSPDGTEICDEDDADEDCDGLADDLDDSTDSGSIVTWYRDQDADGFGDADHSVQHCDSPEGYSALDTDCDDSRSDVNPDATEVCDEDDADEDCDGLADSTDDSADPSTHYAFYEDADGDGYGDATSTVADCDAPSGYVEDDTDCDDSLAEVNPGATEVCDDEDLDEDCDELPDDYDDSVDSSSYGTWYEDADGDGYGDAASPISQCEQPTGYVEDATDCDDVFDHINPGGQEICDADDQDEDCDGQADSLDRSVSEDSLTTFYQDADADGYGDAAVTTTSCDPPSGFVDEGTDCDDTRDDISPDATEVCDDADADEDCDGLADDDDSSTDMATFTTWYADTDGDSFGDLTQPAGFCDAPDGYVEDYTDCDDTVGTTYPGAEEVCNEVDDDCDGDTDENVTITYHVDVDGDGEGSTATAMEFCDLTPPEGWSEVDTDCDDYDPYVFTGAPELCDGQQNDCDDASWTAGDEDETASHEDVDGTWTDLADSYGAGSPTVPTAVTLPSSGTVHLCPANWYALLTAESGSEVTVSGRYGYADTVINGASGGSVVTLEDASVSATLEDLTIEEGLAPEGAGINSQGGELSVTTCLFRYNYLDLDSNFGYGAGIYADGGTVTVSDTIFKVNANATSYQSFGGAIAALEADLDVSGSTFENNDADWGGAIAWQASTTASLAVELCSFEDNEAEGDGGALFIEAHGSGDVSVVDCSFEDNDADEDGGAIYLEGLGSGTVSLTDGIFDNNSADGYGGGVSWEVTNPHVASSWVMSGNDAEIGGSLCALADLELSDAEMGTGTASYGAGIYAADAELTLSAVTVTANEAEMSGAGIYIDGGALYCDTCAITDNEVPASASTCYGGTATDPYCAGAGIYAEGDAWLSASTVTGNLQLTSEDSFGGGIWLSDGDLVLDESTQVSGNEAQYGAGVLLFGDAVDTSLTMESGAEITANTGEYYAGLYLETATFTCTGATTNSTGITAHAEGGGVYVHYEHGPTTIVDADVCDFGASGGSDDNVSGGSSDADVYVSGAGWFGYGDDATFVCDETGCF